MAWNVDPMPPAVELKLGPILRQGKLPGPMILAIGTRGQSGPSGTGKTLAATVLARLRKPVIAVGPSHFIGETEKNLSALFDRAESTGAVLLFDEADALFGKRSNVSDAHDRFANQDVSFLLSLLGNRAIIAILIGLQGEKPRLATPRNCRWVDLP